MAPVEVSSTLGFPAASGFARSVDDAAMKGGQRGKCEIFIESITVMMTPFDVFTFSPTFPLCKVDDTAIEVVK